MRTYFAPEGAAREKLLTMRATGETGISASFRRACREGSRQLLLLCDVKGFRLRVGALLGNPGVASGFCVGMRSRDHDRSSFVCLVSLFPRERLSGIARCFCKMPLDVTARLPVFFFGLVGVKRSRVTGRVFLKQAQRAKGRQRARRWMH